MSPYKSLRRFWTRRAGLRRQLLVAFVSVLTGLFLVPTAAADQQPEQPGATQEQQVLTWTAGNSVTEYLSAPETAEAGTATIVFSNTQEDGNTTGMSHTLTFDTATPGYNHDVDLNITANPYDDNGGYYEAEVTLTPGTYRYFCAIPGHGMMTGELVVTESGDPDPGDSTPPEVVAEVSGEQDADGNYVGSAEVVISATDDDSGVESVEYRLDGGEFGPYESPVSVSEVGDHVVDFRATDAAGNTAEDSVEFSVVEESDPGDSTPPEVVAEVSGEQDADGNYVGSAEVVISATDDDSGVESVEYRLDGGEFGPYESPVSVSEVGDHVVDFRATDAAGNTAEDSVEFTVVEEEGDPDPGQCPDDRATVVIAEIDTGVTNLEVSDGCTINDAIDETADYADHGEFVRHVGQVVQPLADDALITQREADTIVRAAIRSEIGR